jgi:hypothetical protein
MVVTRKIWRNKGNNQKLVTIPMNSELREGQEVAIIPLDEYQRLQATPTQTSQPERMGVRAVLIDAEDSSPMQPPLAIRNADGSLATTPQEAMQNISREVSRRVDEAVFNLLDLPQTPHSRAVNLISEATLSEATAQASEIEQVLRQDRASAEQYLHMNEEERERLVSSRVYIRRVLRDPTHYPAEMLAHAEETARLMNEHAELRGHTIPFPEVHSRMQLV